MSLVGRLMNRSRDRRSLSAARRRSSRMEILEVRWMPAPLLVTTLADAGTGSLRDAITRANADPDRDVITFGPGVAGTISLATPLPDLATAIDLQGPGASALTVARSA